MMNYRFTYGDDMAEPLTLDDAKNYLKLDFDTDDVLIASVITSAREQAERFCNRCFVAKTIEFATTEFDLPVLLPFPNHNEITEVLLDDVAYTGWTKTGITQLTVTINDSIDTTKELKVTYTAGGDITESEKNAIKKVIADMYRNRDESGILSENAMMYLMPYKVYQ